MSGNPSIAFSDIDDKELDALLASEMNKMSMKEREEVYCDVHGVSDVVEETKEFVAEKLKQLGDKFRAISDNATAY